MPVSELLEIAKTGEFESFESRCLELLDAGRLTLRQLIEPFRQIERDGHGERLTTLTQMICENTDTTADPASAVELARIALVAAPKSAELRQLAVKLYRQAYGDQPGFEVVMEASGLAAARPVRMALKLLDLCLTLKPGDTLISRMDDHVVEVTEVDRDNGLFTLRHRERTTTRPAPEVVREFDRVLADDFRVLRALRPEQLAELMVKDPVAVVIGLIRAHGGRVDADVLKHELVPRYIEPGDWSSWWTSARNKCKRNPHVLVEGRSPMILSYTADARTIEDETWEVIETRKDLGQWIAAIEGYIREKTARKEEPRAELLLRFHDHLIQYIHAVRDVRPAEALSCALSLERLEKKGVPVDDANRTLAHEMLRKARRPIELMMHVEPDSLRERGLDVLNEVRPDEWADFALHWLPEAPANLFDRLVGGALEAGRRNEVQAFIDSGLNDLAGHPELVFWLWKGPRHAAQLNLPADQELFRMIMDGLDTLGRTISTPPEVVRQFRLRMKAALALRGYAKAKEAIASVSEAAAITLRRQAQRLEGMGDNTPAQLLDALRDAHPRLWVVKQKRVEPWEDTGTLWCTSAGLARRTAERDEIVNVKMRENAKRIGDAASHGDLSENSEYKFALEERDLLRAQLANINEELSQARVLTIHDVPDDHVGIGSRVTLHRADDDSTRTMTFLGPFETNVETGFFSYMAPFSQKFMGHHVGDRLTVALDGRDVEIEIVALANGLEQPIGNNAPMS